MTNFLALWVLVGAIIWLIDIWVHHKELDPKWVFISFIPLSFTIAASLWVLI